MSDEGLSAMEVILQRAEMRADAQVNGEELIELAPGETSLTFFQKIYRSVRQPMSRRMRAAEYAIQHEHPKLGAMAVGSLSGQDFASLLERAIRASGKAYEVKQIEGRVIAPGDESAG